MNDMNISQMIDDGALITAGSCKNFNTMTIGWGLIGTIWRRDVFMCFVRPSRYTFNFLENNDYFTISFYKNNYKKEIAYLGTKSGRDVDKVNDVKFTPIEALESVTFKEAYLTLVCKKIYFQDMNENMFLSDVKNKYYKDGDVHRMYLGEIVARL